MFLALRISWVSNNIPNPVCITITTDAINAALLVGGNVTGVVSGLIQHDQERLTVWLETPIEDESKRAEWVRENYEAIQERVKGAIWWPVTWN